MFSNAFSRTILAAVVAAIVIVPVGHADSWARDGRALDPAIATAIGDRATVPAGLDPAIATAIRERTTLAPESLAIAAAIHTAQLERPTFATRPDDRAAARGVGSLPQARQAAASEAVDWGGFGLGAGAFAALLLALGSVVAVRRRQAAVRSA
ncbi:MAG TPA: hypothetical protein VFY02_11140 [Gaiellaceae bacterium]|nr:hypothetical protein [Gaiellaceae bacterium]